ncbi:hypothetical protein SLS62_005740 [Diatrype stigma]|uniref:DUF6589 domain-containing protein n=1 Tax=Diatrype stigma TaxID=117547 RepID=A0AAN9US16_9PEZI
MESSDVDLTDPPTDVLSSELSEIPSQQRSQQQSESQASRQEVSPDELEGLDDDQSDLSEAYPEEIVPKTTNLWKNLRDANRYAIQQGDEAKQYNLKAFLSRWVENSTRRKQLADALSLPEIQEALATQGLAVISTDPDAKPIPGSFSTRTVRREMQSLIREPPFGDFEPHKDLSDEDITIAKVCSTEWLQKTLEQGWPTLKEKAPTMVTFLTQLLRNQDDSYKDVVEMTSNEGDKGYIYLLAALLLRGYARNTSRFLRMVLGLYMLANGTPRRVIDTLSGLGIVFSYTTLNNKLSEMAKQAEKNIKRVAHDPTGVIVYDNFNFLNKVRELVGGKQAQMINLTTSCLVSCPELQGPLSQRSLNLKQPFTRSMILKYLLPRPPSLDKVSKYLVKFSIMKLIYPDEKDKLPKFPAVQCVNYKESPYLQLGAIFEDEGTVEGVYKLHEELWKRRLEFKEFDDRLTLIYGDQKTTSFIRRIKQSQLEASDLWEQKKWMLPIPAFFHVELNYIEMLFRNFWDAGKEKSSAVIKADVDFFQRGRHINKKDLKYHQTVPLLVHGFTARILAFVIHGLRIRGVLAEDQITIEGIKEAIITHEGFLDVILEETWSKVFTKEGWTGRYPGVDDDHIDLEFRSQCRLMQCVEIFLTIHEAVRQGDFGLLRDIIPQLPIIFWGGRSFNYGPEMLYFAWLLHPDVCHDGATRDAILKGGLIRCITAGSKYKAIDLMLEHINAVYAIDIKHNKNSTHDLRSTFSRLALNGNYLATIRKSVERTLSATYSKGTHKPGDAFTDIMSYACKLYKDGVTQVGQNIHNDAYDAPDIFERGQQLLLQKLADFNDAIPEPVDAADQRAIPGVNAAGGTDDDIIDWGDEGERLFDAADEAEAEDFWSHGLGDLSSA